MIDEAGRFRARHAVTGARHAYRRQPDGPADEPLDRRQFLRGALAGATGLVLGGAIYATKRLTTPARPPVLLWSEEFDGPLDLATAGSPLGRWRASDVWQSLDVGYADFGAGGRSCWLANPHQRLGGIAYNPFSVRDSVLSISARRTPAGALAAADRCPWLGGVLISNTDRADMTFGYGYYEFRVRLPNPGQGMFPALWFYAAHGQNPDRQAAAEIDLLEIFGYPRGRPWVVSLHEVAADGKGSQRQVLSRKDDTSGWHTYGLHWTVDQLGFYRDRTLLSRVTGSDARFYAGCRMSIRMDYSMDATWFGPAQRSGTSTPDVLRMDVDYVRRYDRPF